MNSGLARALADLVCARPALKRAHQLAAANKQRVQAFAAFKTSGSRILLQKNARLLSCLSGVVCLASLGVVHVSYHGGYHLPVAAAVAIER